MSVALRESGLVLLVVVLASLPFLQVAGFSFLNYDDPLHISTQPMVIKGVTAESVAWSMTATPSNLWHPLTWMSYMAEVSFLGGGADAPGVHHIGNLALHLAATCFFYLLLRSLRISALVAALVALLFSVHPLHVEPVAWISSRKDVLYAFFAMASLWCYSGSQRADKNRGIWSCVTMLTMVAALASKPSAIILPVLFILIDYLPDIGNPGSVKSAQGSLIRSVLWKWPYIVLAGVAAGSAIVIQYTGSHQPFIAGQGVLERLSLLPASLGFYLQHAVWPWPLCFDYAAPHGTRLTILSLAGVILLLGISAGAWRLRQRFPAMLIGWLWFLVCLAPVLGFFYVGTSFTSDRYTYLALAGPALALAVWLDSWQGDKRRAAIFSLVFLLTVFLTVLLGVMSYQQSKVWANDEALFSQGVAFEPGSDVAHTNLAGVYRLQGKDDLALYHYSKALGLASRRYIIYFNIAQIQHRRGEHDHAIESCREALNDYDHYACAHHMLGQLLEKKEPHTDEAMEHLEKAFRMGEKEQDPWLAKYAYSCGLAYAKRSRYADAERILLIALQRAPMTTEQRGRIDKLLVMLQPYLAK